MIFVLPLSEVRNPITTSLFRGAQIRRPIIYSRVMECVWCMMAPAIPERKKVAQITADKTAMEAVKVCWEGQGASKNCGQCEKCIRTQLNFLAVGVSRPPCFQRQLDPHLITTMNFRNSAQFNEVASVYSYAQRKGIKDMWVKLLKSRIDHYRNPPGKFRKLLLPTFKGFFAPKPKGL
jgi:hypothetical protein